MTATELATLIRTTYTKTNSTTFADAEMLILVNNFLWEIASQIVERNAGYFLIPATFDLSDDIREYRFSDDQLSRMHKLEIKFDSSSARFPSTYMKDYKGSETESEIVANFSNNEGDFAHTIRRNAVFILSGTIVDVTGGGRLWYHKYPAKLTSMSGSTELNVDPSTSTFGFPKQFHELLARRVSIAWKGSQPKQVPLSALEKNYEVDLEKQLAAISTNDNSGEVVGERANGDASWDNGYNL